MSNYKTCYIVAKKFKYNSDDPNFEYETRSFLDKNNAYKTFCDWAVSSLLFGPDSILLDSEKDFLSKLHKERKYEIFYNSWDDIIRNHKTDLSFSITERNIIND